VRKLHGSYRYVGAVRRGSLGVPVLKCHPADRCDEHHGVFGSCIKSVADHDASLGPFVHVLHAVDLGRDAAIAVERLVGKM